MTDLNHDKKSVRIIPFEKQYQEQVVKLFVEGLTKAYISKGETMVKLQEWFVREKLSENCGGDMYCIWDSYMKRTSHIEPTDSTNFWIAIDDSKNKVVGCVGLVSCNSGHDQRYAHEKETGPFDSCELQRMSVHNDYRGQNLGKRLCQTVEEHAISKGVKKIIVSTLSVMHLARKLYEACGYKYVKDRQLPEEWLESVLGTGNWDKMFVSHYEKYLK